MRLVMENCMLPVSRTLLILSAFLFVRSQSQVPDDVVIMDTNPVLLLGRQGDLQCRFNQDPIAVYWLKGETFESAEDLITLHTGGITTPLEKNKGLYDINDEYSLVIFNVTDDTTGTYYCRVSDYRGYIIRSHTSVTVRTPPNDPYPAIDGCLTGAPCAIELPNRNAADITCRTEDASVGLVSLAWKSGCSFGDQATEKRPNPDGLTENVAVTISAVPCNESYECVADLAATRIDQTTASIRVSGPLEIESTTIVLTAGTTAANITNVSPVLNGGKIAAAVLLPLLVVGLLVLGFICYCRNGTTFFHYVRIPKGDPDQEYIGRITYIELWNLVNLGVDETFRDSIKVVIQYLNGGTECSERTVAGLYGKLCAWKESDTSGGGQGSKLSKAMKKSGLKEQVAVLKDFRKDTSHSFSDDDLKHICWTLQGKGQVKKKGNIVLRLLGESLEPSPPKEAVTPFNCSTFNEDNDENQNNDVIQEDLQLLKKWRAEVSCLKKEEVCFHNTEHDIHQAEITNPKVQMCRALEHAGFSEVAKTFFRISTENKRLSTSDLRTFALQISGRHCSKLGKAANFTVKEIRQRNQENIEHIFNTTGMLRDWLKARKCSNYANRHKLEEIAKKSGRTDMKGVFITSEDIARRHTELATLMQEDETQSRDSLSSEKEQVYDVTQEEIDRIQRCAGDEVFQRLCSEFLLVREGDRFVCGKGVSSGGLIEFASSTHGKETENTPRKKIQQVLEREKIGCLMPTLRNIEVCLVELVDVAWRIVFNDVHGFGQALTNRNDVLAVYRMAFTADSAEKGTIAIIRRLYEESKKAYNSRLALSRILKENGFLEAAKLLAFGCHLIGYGDVLAVAKANINCEELFKKLKFGDPTLSCLATLASKGMIACFLCSWKTRIPHSGYNHRTALADALHSLGHTALGLEVLSGKHRTQQSNVIQEELPKLIDNEKKQNASALDDNIKLASTSGDIQDIISYFNKDSRAAQIKRDIMTVIKNMVSKEKKLKTGDLSDELCRAGHYDLAVEIMLGLNPTSSRDIGGGGKHARGSADEGKDATLYITRRLTRKPITLIWGKTNPSDPDAQLESKVVFTDEIVQLDERFSVDKTDYSLTISNLRLSDEGTYVCHVLDDQFNEQWHTATLIFKESEGENIDETKNTNSSHLNPVSSSDKLAVAGSDKKDLGADIRTTLGSGIPKGPDEIVTENTGEIMPQTTENPSNENAPSTNGLSTAGTSDSQESNESSNQGRAPAAEPTTESTENSNQGTVLAAESTTESNASSNQGTVPAAAESNTDVNCTADHTEASDGETRFSSSCEAGSDFEFLSMDECRQ